MDPVSGDRRIVSGCTALDEKGYCTGALIGQGPTLVAPVGIAVEAGGALVVVDVGLQAVCRVDPVSGDRKIVSDATTGTGPPFAEPRNIAVEADGQLVVVNLTTPGEDLKEAVFRVDPKGNRTIVSDVTVGRGPPFAFPSGIDVEADGQLVVVDKDLGAVFRVDPVSGDRRIVSGCTALDEERYCTGALIGQGPALVAPVGIAVEAGGALVVVDVGLQAVCRVDPVSGDRSIVSGCTAIDEEGHCTGALIGQGQALVAPISIAVEAKGTLVVVDNSLGAVIRVDSISGDRTLVSRP